MRRERVSQSELGKRYIKQETSSPGYKAAAPVIVAVVVFFCRYGETPHPGPRLHVTHATATYDAQGKVADMDVTCADDVKQETPCDDVVLASERAYFQETHDMEAADAAKAVKLKAAAKKTHDAKTYR